MKKLSKDEIHHIQYLYSEKGLSENKIVKITGKSKNTINKYLKDKSFAKIKTNNKIKSYAPVIEHAKKIHNLYELKVKYNHNSYTQKSNNHYNKDNKNSSKLSTNNQLLKKHLNNLDINNLTYSQLQKILSSKNKIYQNYIINNSAHIIFRLQQLIRTRRTKAINHNKVNFFSKLKELLGKLF